MADTYVECLIERKTPAYATPVKIGLIVLEIALFVMGMLNALFLIPMIALILVSIFAVPRFYLEYEYVFVGDQLEIDKIINKNSRKRAGVYDMSRVDMVAPENSREITGFTQNPKNKGKVLDYTSKYGEGMIYGMIYNGNKEKLVVLFEPSEKLINAMRYQSPQKVILGY